LPKTAEHLLTECNYKEALWNSICATYNLPSFSSMAQEGGPLQWVRNLLVSGSSKEKKRKLGILFTCWWQIQKERNRRIFEEKELSVPRVAAQIHDHLQLLSQALQHSS
jgi:hypothetical protein